MEYKFIEYQELNSINKGISLKENIQDENYPNQDIIYDYLLNGGIERSVSFKINKDIFNGKTIPFEDIIKYDGTYYWGNVIAYYVKNYNLRLPNDFEKHILENYHNFRDKE